MMLGGSTTSLLSLLNCLSPKKYDIDLQLYRNEGELINLIPSRVNLLPQAFAYNENKVEILKKYFKFILTGYLFKALYANAKKHKKGFSEQVLSEFQARCLSRKNYVKYDFAIGYLEKWANKYLAWCVNSEKKYTWIHSTFEKIAPIPELEFSWIEKVDKVVFVAEDCKDDFVSLVPQFYEKAVTIENILYSNLIMKRSTVIDQTDKFYNIFKEDTRFKIITVCRLTIETKGIDRIIKCAYIMKNKGYQFGWYIVGEGEDRLDIEKRIKEAKLEDCVILTGMKINPYPYIRESNLMCMPSRWEGKPIVITESKILCVPVVVTEYLSANEQVENGEEGFVVANNDDAIIPIIEKIISSPDILNKMKNTLRNREYGNREYIKKIEADLL